MRGNGSAFSQCRRDSGVSMPSATATFDYIIVGAGPAGCATAARLALARPGDTVLLLETGPAKSGFLSDVPVGVAGLVPFQNPRNYSYRTVPQPGLGGRRGVQPRGRGLGGSSLINAMIYMRGQHEDYDDWVNAGATGWSWRDVFPYFLRAENNERGAGDWHATGGPLNVADLASPNECTRRFIEAAGQCGHPLNNDFNGATQEGIGQYQVFQKQGSRYNAARAYIDGLGPKNLTVMAAPRSSASSSIRVAQPALAASTARCLQHAPRSCFPPVRSARRNS